MTPTLTAHIPIVNMSTRAIDVPSTPELLINATRQCFAQIKAKGFNANPSSTNQGDNCELKLTVILLSLLDYNYSPNLML